MKKLRLKKNVKEFLLTCLAGIGLGIIMIGVMILSKYIHYGTLPW